MEILHGIVEWSGHLGIGHNGDSLVHRVTGNNIMVLKLNALSLFWIFDVNTMYTIPISSSKLLNPYVKTLYQISYFVVMQKEITELHSPLKT